VLPSRAVCAVACRTPRLANSILIHYFLSCASHIASTATGGRVLFVCTPSGNEEMFLEIGALGPQPAPEQLAEVSARFGTAGLPGPEGAGWRPQG
jgi:hypothetical protein